MIHILEGRIGAGKTYYIVNWLCEKYFVWNEKFFEWFPKNDIPKIFTNIRDLNLGHVVDINSAIKQAGSLQDFFKVNPVTQELLNPDLKNSIIIIDEAQGPSFFHRKFSNPSVMLFFQLHRHYGCEVWLVTQDVKSLCPELRELPEYHLRAARQSFHFGNYFRYQKFYDDESGARVLVKKDKRVFDVYRSVESKADIVRVPSVLPKYLLIMLLGVCLFIFGGFAIKNWIFGRSLKPVQSAKKLTPPPVPPHPVNAAPAPSPSAAASLSPSSPLPRSKNDLLFESCEKTCEKKGEMKTNRGISTLFDCNGDDFLFLGHNLKYVHHNDSVRSVPIPSPAPAASEPQANVSKGRA